MAARTTPPKATYADIEALGPNVVGVSCVWFVDPLVKTLEVLRLDGSTYRIVGVFRGDATVRAEPFDAIELDLALLWAR